MSLWDTLFILVFCCSLFVVVVVVCFTLSRLLYLQSLPKVVGAQREMAANVLCHPFISFHMFIEVDPSAIADFQGALYLFIERPS